MSTHSEAKTVLALPFNASMADIAFGFKGKPYKGAWKELKVYAIVIVCLLSGVCYILAMEGCETQDVVVAIERHSARYGVPGYIYVDNGTQLKALKHSSMSLSSMLKFKILYCKSSLWKRTSGRQNQVIAIIFWENGS